MRCSSPGKCDDGQCVNLHTRRDSDQKCYSESYIVDWAFGSLHEMQFREEKTKHRKELKLLFWEPTMACLSGVGAEITQEGAGSLLSIIRSVLSLGMLTEMSNILPCSTFGSSYSQKSEVPHGLQSATRIARSVRTTVTRSATRDSARRGTRWTPVITPAEVRNVRSRDVTSFRSKVSLSALLAKCHRGYPADFGLVEGFLGSSQANSVHWFSMFSALYAECAAKCKTCASSGKDKCDVDQCDDGYGYKASTQTCECTLN